MQQSHTSGGGGLVVLRRKMIRDLIDNKGAYISCVIIITIGLMLYVSFSMAMVNLRTAQDDFYASQNFADVFAEVQSIPPQKISDLERITGVGQVDGRLIKEVRVLLPGREDNVYLRLVSTNPDNNHSINSMELISGAPLSGSEMNIWVDNKFFEANHLELNREIEAVVEGKKRNLRVTGFGRSPEFIYALHTSADMFPDPEKFGIAFIPFDVMKTLFPGQQNYNDLVFTLKPGFSYEDIERHIKPALESYGLKTIYPRQDQISHQMLNSEIEGLEKTSAVMPLLFLSVAAMIMYMMLRRMVDQQRGQIGILKAFGYTSGEIVRHYMSYAFTVGILGGVLGGFLGIALSSYFTSLYQMYFNMPGLGGRFSYGYLLISILISVVFSAVAGYLGCRGILALEPAEAMRPPAPPIGRKTLVERSAFLWGLLTVQGRMAIRNLFRHKSRTLFMFLGIVFSFILASMTWSMRELIDTMIYDQYKKVQTFDLKITLSAPLRQRETLGELGQFSGVDRVEPLAEIPVKLKHKWHEKDTVLLGIPAEGVLYNIIDDSNNKIDPPSEGVIISERLADLLDVRAGGEITLESVMMKDPEESKKIRVAGVIPQSLGLNAYMEIESAQRLLGQGPLITSAMLKIDEKHIASLRQEYKSSPVIAAISSQAEFYEKTKKMMQSNSNMIWILILFSIITAFSVIYSYSVITISERSREMASMMVIGMTPREVFSVITFEQWFTAFWAMLAGIPAVKLAWTGIGRAVSTDMFTMPDTITVTSVAVAYIVTIVSVWFTQRLVSRRIGRIGMVEALKSIE